MSDEFLDDFESAVTVGDRTNIKFSALVEKMKARYTPSSNKVKNHYLFHRITQNVSESFDDFAYRIQAEAELCDFKCSSNDCTVKDILIRDQILVGTDNEVIRQEALKNQWGLDDLFKKGRITEPGILAASEIKSEPKYEVRRAKTSPYSRKSRDKQKAKLSSKKFICWKCEEENGSGYYKCPFYNNECKKV